VSAAIVAPVYLPTGAGSVPDPHGLLLLSDVLTDAPPLGFFFVVRSFRVTAGFLLLAGCFVFMGLCVFGFMVMTC